MRILACSLVVFVLTACDGGNGTDVKSAAVQVEPKFSSIHKNILSKTCTGSGCHSHPGEAADLAFDGTNTWEQLVNKDATESATKPWKRVVPDKPEESLLYRLLLDGVGDSLRMPQGSAKLPQQQIDAIKAWIAAGAKKD